MSIHKTLANLYFKISQLKRQVYNRIKLMRRFFAAMMLTASATVLFTACSKSNDDKKNTAPTNNDSRKIKYEITGNYSGKFDVAYSDNINGMTHVTDVTLPWSKEIQYSSNVMTIGIGAQASAVGTPGQTATIKIYSNGTVVKTSTATAGSLGEMLIPTIAYSF